jgi:hypothetical protein
MKRPPIHRVNELIAFQVVDAVVDHSPVWLPNRLAIAMAVHLSSSSLSELLF